MTEIELLTLIKNQLWALLFLVGLFVYALWRFQRQVYKILEFYGYRR